MQPRGAVVALLVFCGLPLFGCDSLREDRSSTPDAAEGPRDARRQEDATAAVDGGAQGPLAIAPAPVLADRLARFLWNAPKDAPLEERVRGISDGAALRQLALSMLRDPRAGGGVRRLVAAWLQSDAPPRAPVLDPALLPRMRRERERFGEEVGMSADGTLTTMLTAPFSYLDRELGALYGVEIKNDEPVRTALDPKDRSGILSQPLLLAQAHGAEVAHRANVVRRLILCQTIPPEPLEAPFPTSRPPPNATRRQKHELRASDGSCGACHRLLDPVGFAFDGLDDEGRVRRRDLDGSPINTTGHLSGVEEEGPFQDLAGLGTRLARSSEGQRCFIARWLGLALDRAVEADDALVLALHRSARARSPDLALHSLGADIVSLPEFNAARSR